MCESRSPPGSPKYKALPAQQRRGLCAFQTEIAARYKALADIERGFPVLKSEIEIAPVFHRLPNRIRAHALICFLALLLYRVLHQSSQVSI
jgi:hypothetical protein